MPKPNPYFKYLGAEDRLQRSVMEYVYTAYPDTVMTHPMNEGKRSKFERFKMKYLMVSSGVPDILIFTPNNKYNGLAIELKTGYNKPTQNQKAWLNRLKTCDWYAIWLNNFDDCKLVIDQYFKNALS